MPLCGRANTRATGAASPAARPEGTWLLNNQCQTPIVKAGVPGLRRLGRASAADERSQIVEQARATAWGSEELGKPSCLLVVESYGCTRGAALVPDAHAHALLWQVARHPERAPLVRVRTREELDELAPLRRRTPGAVAVLELDLSTAAPTVRHAPEHRAPREPAVARGLTPSRAGAPLPPPRRKRRAFPERSSPSARAGRRRPRES
jgi:hypothetical protein